jgi:hypothetical protein
MALIINFIFLIYGLVCSANSYFWRFFLLSLFCQLSAQWLGSLEIFINLQWVFDWFLPLVLLLIGMNQDQNLSLGARGLFLIAWVFCICLGFADHFYLNKMFQPKPIAPVMRIETTIYDSKPKIAKEDQWETLTSAQGRFRVLSPLPAATIVNYKKIQELELKLTSTQIKDLNEDTRYIILTTHYPKEFERPSDYDQAKLAIDHLIITYQCDQILELEAIELSKRKALGFHAKISKTNEFLVGVALPTPNILYQILIFSKDEASTEEKSQQFLSTFEPLI